MAGRYGWICAGCYDQVWTDVDSDESLAELRVDEESETPVDNLQLPLFGVRAE
jgi:hypothetical protein